MSFDLPDHWVWDCWIADDGETFHLFYLHAPTALGDPELRHRNARIGHATSSDLRVWTDHGPVLDAGSPGAPDETATWTGSVVADPDGTWRMFYTGASFDGAGRRNRETVLAATSPDLATWTKVDGFAIAADPRWYEVLDDGTWHEEAWRDPWVVADPAGHGWHMLVTARGREGADEDRGVIGHATSPDLRSWTLGAPLTRPGAGFAHLEVPQTLSIDGADFVVFSCDAAHLRGARRGERGGVWAMRGGIEHGVDPSTAALVTDEPIYAGRVVRDRDGRWMLIGFEFPEGDGSFVGRISDPLPLVVDASGHLTTHERQEAR